MGANKPPIARIDPGRIDKIFIKAKKEEQAPQIRIPKITKKTKRGKLSKEKVPFNELFIKSVSVYNEQQLQKLFCKYVTGNITLDGLYDMSEILTQKYRDDGYILSHAYVPTQRIRKGSISMHVVEGFIGNTFVDTNNITKSTANIIKNYANKVSDRCPTHIKQLERYVLLANDLPGIQAKTYLKPSEKTCGASDLHMIAKRKSFDFNVSINNEISRRYGSLMFTAGGFVNDLVMGSRTGVIIRTSSDVKRMQLYNFSHSQIINSEGLRFNFTGQYVKNSPHIKSNVQEYFHISGDSYLLSTGITFPWIRTRQSSVALQGTLDMLRSNSDTTLHNQSAFSIKDRIWSLRAGVNFEHLDAVAGSNLAAIEFSKGLTGNSNKYKSRFDGRNDYFKFNFEASRMQMLTQQATLLFATEGQYSFHGLLSAEEFGIGGPHLGRGYDPSEIVGDHGIGAKVEARYQQFDIFKFIARVQYYVFLDAGKVWNINEGKSIDIDQPNVASIVSTGAGVRFNFKKNFTGSLEITKPINRNLAQSGNKKPRFFFSVQYVM